MAQNDDATAGDMLEEEEYRPWYKDRAIPPPFKLSRKITVGLPVLNNN